MSYPLILHRIGAEPMAALIFFTALGYFCGSLPFSIWITRFVKGVDVRDAGSGHATTTNTIRQAGFLVGSMVLLLDIAKGFLPVFLASQSGAPGWIVGVASAGAVAGHCWPLFAKFRGGMGLATAGGGYLALSPISFAITLGLLIILVLTVKHSARASVYMGIAAAPVLMLFRIDASVIWLALLTGIVIAGRFTIDWRRNYNELWLDRS